MKKGFLAKSILISILILDLIGTVLHLMGATNGEWTDSPVERIMTSIHDGSLGAFVRGEKKAEPETRMAEVESVEDTEIVTEATESVEMVVTENDNPFTVVDDSYFSDALLIGDSRIGLVEFWDGMPGMTYYDDAGFSIYDALKKEFCWDHQVKVTLASALSNPENHFGKIYIEFGVNGAGYDSNDRFREANMELINMIKEYQPDALIFLCSVMRVTTEFSNRQPPVVTNEQLNNRSSVLRELADNDTIFYLEVNDYCCDESGGLRADWTNDGYHLDSSYSYVWRDCFLEHGVIK